MNQKLNPETNPTKSIHCVVIQLSDIDKTLMSLMALKAVKQLYPQICINMIVKEDSVALLEKVEWIDHVSGFDVDSLVDSVLKKEVTEKQSLGTIARWIAPFIGKPWDYVLDWTFTDSSSYLCSLIPAYRKIGYYRSPELMLSCSDDWSHYIQAIVQSGIPQDIHMTDILTTQFLTSLQIHFGASQMNDVNDSITQKDFFKLNLSKLEQSSFDRTAQKKWVSIHISHKQNWDSAHWLELCELVLQRHPGWGVVLSSDDSSKERVKKVYEMLVEKSADIGRIKRVFGKVSFDYWVYCLSQSEAVITFDSVAQHCASLLGLRVISLNSSVSFNFQAAAYGNLNYLIDGKRLDPKIVYSVFAHGFHSGPLTFRKEKISEYLVKMGWNELLEGVHIYSSQIRSVDEGGGVYYENIFEKSTSVHQWIGHLNAHVARQWYCGWAPRIEDEIKREFLSPHLLKELREIKIHVEDARQLIETAYNTAVSIAKKTEKLKPNGIMSLEDKNEIQDSGKILTSIDQKLLEISEKCIPVQSMSNISRVMMHNLKGQTLLEISQESVKAYLRLKEGIRVMSAWLEYCFVLSRPKAITQEKGGESNV